jgi:hypothetical protein
LVSPHIPAAEQVCTVLFEHCVAPGAHDTQAPFQHTGVVPEQVVLLVQCPVASQVWVTLPMHWVCPAAQTPVQAPPTQVWFTQHVSPQAAAPSHPWVDDSMGRVGTSAPESVTVTSVPASTLVSAVV